MTARNGVSHSFGENHKVFRGNEKCYLPTRRHSADINSPYLAVYTG